MEYHVIVEKLCACARRKEMPQIKTFDDQENALRVARAWAQELNETFCSKHEFSVIPLDDNFQETSLRERYSCFVIAVGEGSY